MNLATRLNKLETALKNKHSANPIDEEKYQEFEDWVKNDPRAKELIKKEYDYCIEKGYPPRDPDFFDDLEDPVFWEIAKEEIDAFNSYLEGRRTA